jgi:hypothetical protein
MSLFQPPFRSLFVVHDLSSNRLHGVDVKVQSNILLIIVVLAQTLSAAVMHDLALCDLNPDGAVEDELSVGNVEELTPSLRL